MDGGLSQTKNLMANRNVGYGRALLDAVASQVPAFGRLLIVKNPNDSADYNYQDLSEVFGDGQAGRAMFFTSLSDAYTEAQSNNNDVICLDGHTSHKLTAMLTVDKNRVHFLGFNPGGRLEDQRTLISNTGTGAATDTAMIKNTGTGNTFKNIKFANNWTVAQNVYCFDAQGAQSAFENCTFQNLGSAHLTNNAAASLRLSEDTSFFKHCTIGQDTLKVTSTGGQQMLIAKGASAAATRCTFEDCVWRAYTSDTSHSMIQVSATGDIDREIRLVRPAFLNFNYDASNGGAQMAVAITSPNTLVSGGFLVENPSLLFCTKLATNAVGNGGVYVSINTNPTAASAAAVKATT